MGKLVKVDFKSLSGKFPEGIDERMSGALFNLLEAATFAVDECVEHKSLSTKLVDIHTDIEECLFRVGLLILEDD